MNPFVTVTYIVAGCAPNDAQTTPLSSNLSVRNARICRAQANIEWCMHAPHICIDNLNPLLSSAGTCVCVCSRALSRYLGAPPPSSLSSSAAASSEPFAGRVYVSASHSHSGGDIHIIIRRIDTAHAPHDAHASVLHRRALTRCVFSQTVNSISPHSKRVHAQTAHTRTHLTNAGKWHIEWRRYDVHSIVRRCVCAQSMLSIHKHTHSIRT